MIEYFEANRVVFAAVLGIGLLLVMVVRWRLSAFPALITISILTGLLSGIGFDATLSGIQEGMGGTLGYIAVVVGLGSMLGVLIQQSGGIEALAQKINQFSAKTPLDFLVAFLGLIVAIPVFFDVALIIFAPLLFSMAKKIAKPVMFLAIPLLAGLATAHAFIPPTPGPVAVAEILKADIGLVIAFGLVVGMISILVAGPLWTRFLTVNGLMDQNGQQTAETLFASSPYKAPGLVAKTMLIIIFPIFLILLASTLKMMGLDGDRVAVFLFLGHPFTALLLACGLAWLLFKPADEKQKQVFRNAIEKALEPAGAVILITGAGGAFKQILIDTGAGKVLADTVVDFGLLPLVAAYGIAALVRISQGSATVAMITAAGLMAPIAAELNLPALSLALMVIAVAAGATGFSHVNDSGFWLVSRYFNLTPKQTLLYWTSTTTIISLTGFGLVLILHEFLI